MEINLSPKKGINLSSASYRPAAKARSLNFSLTEVALLVVMIGLFSWYMILPKKAAMEAQQAQVTQLEADKKKIDGEVKALEESIKLLSKNKSEVAELDEALPLDSRSTKLQMLVQDLAGKAGVVIETLSFEDDAKKVYAADQETIKDPFSQARTLKSVQGSVGVLGKFEQIQDFIGKIEKSARLLNILSMNLNLQEDDVMSLTLQLEAYSYE